MKISVSQKKHSSDSFRVAINGRLNKHRSKIQVYQVSVLRPEKVAINIIKLKNHVHTNAVVFSFSRNTFSWRHSFSYSLKLVFVSLFIAGFFASGVFLIPPPKISNSIIITNVVAKQTSRIVVGQPIAYTMLVKRNLITSQQYLLQIPKNAINITIKNRVASPAEKNSSNEVSSQSLINTKEAKFINFSQPTLVSGVLSKILKSVVAQALTTDETVISEMVPDSPETIDQDKELPKDIPVPIIDQPVSADDSGPSKIVEPDQATPTPSKDVSPDALESSDYVQIDYQIPGPVVVAQDTVTGKLVTVSAPDEKEETPLLDVLAFTKIPEIFEVGQERNIQVQWQNNNNNQAMVFVARDVDGNGYLDYLEWTVPHL